MHIKKSFLLFTITLLFSMNNSFSYSLPESSKKNAMVAAALATSLAVFRYSCKHPKKDFNIRYKLSKENLTSPSGLINYINQFGSIKEFFNECWYILDDGIIGCGGNSSRSIRVDADTGKVTAKERVSPYGLMGWTHAYLSPVFKGIEIPVKYAERVAALAIAFGIWQMIFDGKFTFENSEKAFKNGKDAVVGTFAGKTVTIE